MTVNQLLNSLLADLQAIKTAADRGATGAAGLPSTVASFNAISQRATAAMAKINEFLNPTPPVTNFDVTKWQAFNGTLVATPPTARVDHTTGTFFSLQSNDASFPAGTPGLVYTAQAEVRAANAGTVGKPITLSIRERDGAGHALGTVLGEASSSAIALTTAFQSITITYTAKQASSHVDVRASCREAVAGNSFEVRVVNVQTTTGPPSPPPPLPPPPLPVVGVTTQTLLTGLDTVWALAFAPNGDLFFSERNGRVSVLSSGVRTTVMTVPGVETSEGGLQGMCLHPNFPTTPYIYVYYSPSNTINRLARYTYNTGTKLAASPLTLLDNIPGFQFHNGGRIKFGPDGKLYVCVGDAADNGSQASINAQSMSSLAGKILRLNDDGTIPSDNPTAGSRIYSRGHRNPQGLAWRENGQLWITEHGPTGTNPDAHDEINRVVAGGNYGWPYFAGTSDNVNFTTPSGFTHTAPVLDSGSTVWAPGGATFYDGDEYGATWNEALIFTGLGIQGRSSGGFVDGRALYRLPISGTQSVGALQRHFFNEFGRIRDVVQGPDDFLYMCTSNMDGRGTGTSDRIIKLVPVVQTPPVGTVTMPGYSPYNADILDNTGGAFKVKRSSANPADTFFSVISNPGHVPDTLAGREYDGTVTVKAGAVGTGKTVYLVFREMNPSTGATVATTETPLVLTGSNQVLTVEHVATAAGNRMDLRLSLRGAGATDEFIITGAPAHTVTDTNGGPGPVTQLPGIPTGLVVSAGDSSLTATWSARPVNEGADNYQIYLDGATHKLDITGTTFTMTGLNGGQLYSVRVSAHNAMGYGPWSAPVSAAPTGTAPGPGPGPTPGGSLFDRPFPQCAVYQKIPATEPNAPTSVSMSSSFVSVGRNSGSGSGVAPRRWQGIQGQHPVWLCGGRQLMYAPADIVGGGLPDDTIEIYNDMTPDGKAGQVVRMWGGDSIALRINRTPSGTVSSPKTISGSTYGQANLAGNGVPYIGNGTAWGLFSVLGVILRQDWNDGVIDHAVGFGLGNNILSPSRFIAPAIRSESKAYGTLVPMGTRFQHNFTDGEIATHVSNAGLTGNKAIMSRMIFKAMREYGAIVRDGTGANGCWWYTDHGSQWSGLSISDNWYVIFRVSGMWNSARWRCPARSAY